MKLEQEAKDFMEGNRKQFKEGLVEYLSFVEQYIDDNLYECDAKEQALTRLLEVSFWANHGAETYGIK